MYNIYREEKDNMKKANTKNYTVRSDGKRLTVSMLEKGTDGHYHSMQVPLPYAQRVLNEETHEIEVKVLRRPSIIKMCLTEMSKYYDKPDGKK